MVIGFHNPITLSMTIASTLQNLTNTDLIHEKSIAYRLPWHGFAIGWMPITIG
jgi:hypothetical protein